MVFNHRGCNSSVHLVKEIIIINKNYCVAFSCGRSYQREMQAQINTLSCQFRVNSNAHLPTGADPKRTFK